MKFFCVTFGCKVNQYETQALREAWQAQGAVECSSPAGADVICINSCAITGKGERDARNAVYRLRREAPHAKIVLTGCAAKLVDAFQPRPNAPHERPDIILPQTDKARLLQLSSLLETSAERFGANNAPPAKAGAREYPPFAISHFHRARPVLKVQDGCAHRCTYCIVPLTRGQPVSREPAAIVAEARRLLCAGHVELMVSGINLAQYGRDRPEYGDFWHMLRTLDAALAPEFGQSARLRISSLEPSQLLGKRGNKGADGDGKRGLETLASCSMACPHLHISLQHTSRHVLRRMGRGHYGVEDLYTAVEALRRHWPRMGLGCDVLVGFPGESDADIDCLLGDIASLPLTYAHVFPYSARPGTAAASFPGQIPRSEKLARAKAVRDAVAQRQQAFLREQMACTDMLLAPESAQLAGSTEALRGVNQYYVDCELEVPQPAHGLQAHNVAGKGLLPVLPTGVRGNTLVVRPAQGNS